MELRIWRDYAGERRSRVWAKIILVTGIFSALALVVYSFNKW